MVVRHLPDGSGRARQLYVVSYMWQHNAVQILTFSDTQIRLRTGFSSGALGHSSPDSKLLHSALDAAREVQEERRIGHWLVDSRCGHYSPEQ